MRHHFFPEPLGPQSRFGDKLLENRVDCPQNWTAVLKRSSKGARYLLWHSTTNLEGANNVSYEERVNKVAVAPVFCRAL